MSNSTKIKWKSFLWAAAVTVASLTVEYVTANADTGISTKGFLMSVGMGLLIWFVKYGKSTDPTKEGNEVNNG